MKVTKQENCIVCDKPSKAVLCDSCVKKRYKRKLLEMHFKPIDNDSGKTIQLTSHGAERIMRIRQ